MIERTVEQKLNALLKLQNIDSKLDDIRRMRGDLPNEVQDLEDSIAGLQTRINNFKNDIKNFEDEINNRKERKKQAEKLIVKYKEQQNNVRNNREFEALSKEIESEELEIQLCDKKIKDAQDKITKKQTDIAEVEKIAIERQKDLEAKKEELGNILKESEEDEQKLLKDREKQTKNIEERLLRSYNKIRDNSINGLAVVMVKRDACGGCFNIVPPQRQADIREKKKIIVCEHCGRILAGVEEIVPQEEKKTRGRKPGSTNKKDDSFTTQLEPLVDVE
jgi:predicted  nucleic acid-binding Zn-ribbon protein